MRLRFLRKTSRSDDDFRDDVMPDTRFERPETDESGNESDETEGPVSEEDDEDS